MRPTRRAVWAGVASVVLLVSPVHAQDGGAAAQPAGSDGLGEPVELAAETTIRASESGVVRVSLPKEVTFTHSFGPEGMFEVEGDGPFVGFVLTDDVPERNGRLVIAGHLHREPSPLHFLESFPGVTTGDSRTFPPGQYLLYTLASGSAMSVTLRLPELTGAVEVTPTVPNRFDARFLEPRIWEESERFIYSAGEDGELHTTGLMLMSLWVNTSMHVVGSYGTCMYQGGAPEPAPYLPECPDGDDVFSFTPFTGVPPRPSDSLGAFSLLRGDPPGTYGLGTWYASPSMVSDAGSVVFWLDLE